MRKSTHDLGCSNPNCTYSTCRAKRAKAKNGYTINTTADPSCEPRTAAWSIARNPALSNKFATMYTLYWRGLVRGQLVNHTNAKTICDQLNLSNVDGSETGGIDTQLVAG